MKVSLCTVVFNEEHRVKKFLEQAAPHVDEIILVDQSSTDDTVNKAFEWRGANHETYPDQFLLVVRDKHWGFCEPSRKLAHQAATGDFILVLDADERISNEAAATIKAFKHNHPSVFGKKAMRLKRSLWITGVHYWTGDYQYRFFDRNSVRYLDELHTEPQATIPESQVLSPEFVGIWHDKSWVEQIRDENAYEGLINPNDARADAKRALNVYSRMLEEAGLTPEEADKAAEEGTLADYGIAPIYEPPQQEKL